MKALLVYDSVYGNTEKLARAIAEGIKGAVSIKRAAEVVPDDFNEIGLFLIGSPIQGGRPLKSIQLLINSLNGPATTGLPTATFDTRMTGTLPKIFGWAAKKMADALLKKGVKLVVQPEGFFVKGKEGPLLDGEIERGKQWGAEVQAAAEHKE